MERKRPSLLIVNDTKTPKTKSADERQRKVTESCNIPVVGQVVQRECCGKGGHHLNPHNLP